MHGGRSEPDPWLALEGREQAPDAIPAPPYQLKDVDFLMVGVAFDEKAILPFMPKGLRPLPGATGASPCIRRRQAGESPLIPPPSCGST